MPFFTQQKLEILAEKLFTAHSQKCILEGTELLSFEMLKKMLDFGLKKSKFWNCLKKVILIDFFKKRIFFSI